MPSLAQQVFIQEMMGIHAMKANEATELYNDCLERAGEQREVLEDDLGDELEGANSMLRRFDMQLTATMCDGSVWWGLVSTSRDEELAKISCAYTNMEVTFFQAISNEIRSTEDGFFPLVSAQNLAKEVRLPVAEGGRVIKRLADAMWLSIERKHGESYVKYGPRSVLELPEARSYVRDQLGGVANNENGVEASSKRLSKRRRSIEELEEEEMSQEEEIAPQRRARKSRRTERKSEDTIDEIEVQEARPKRSNRNRVNRSTESSKHSRRSRRNVVEEEDEDEDEIMPQERPTRRRPTTRSSQQREERASQSQRRFTRSQQSEQANESHPIRRSTRRR